MGTKIDKEVLLRYVNGEFTPADRKYIEDIFTDENLRPELQKHLSADWLALCSQDRLEEHDMAPILHKLYYNIKHQDEGKKKGVLVTLWRTYRNIAAAILLPLVLAYGYSQLAAFQPGKEDRLVSYAEIQAPLGSRVTFSLPDGSTGWLNGGSTLKYPVMFAGSRDVELTGEAYFDVKKNVNKPFNVKAGDINISVLGTRFNVAAYSDDSNVDVVLESGKVRLYDMKIKKYIEMEPDERVVYEKKEHKVISKEKVNTRKYSSWKEGKLVFRNDPIEEVAKKLGRWYNVDIEVNQSPGTDFRLRATFVDEDIEEVLRLLKLTFPIDYSFEKRKKDAEGKFAKRKIILNVK